ncbi:MAG: transposase [Dehalococcoidales bacterium]|nr:transposase [Dehalococcoidales bacterium]
MIKIKDPRQPELFDRFSELLGPSAYKRMKNGWHGCFRECILYLLSVVVEKFSDNFSTLTGPETKELFSMAGLMVIKDFFNWSHVEAMDRYNADLTIQYALNIDQGVEISRATYFRYQKLFREEELGRLVMRKVTDELLQKANVDISKQRLDSTHVFSNMAVFSRRRLIHHTIYAFLVQLKRRQRPEYEALQEALRNRYSSDDGWCFAENSPMLTLHYGNRKATAEEQLGYDLRHLLERFHADAEISNGTKYKIMRQVFNEQFADDGQPQLKKNPGGKVLVNPSDPDAEIGHKGAGYQVQIMQTYGEENEVQMITNVLPQGASASDMDSLKTMVDMSIESGTKPEKGLTDAGYGSDDNVCYAKEKGIELIAPTTGKKKGQLGLEECVLDELNRIERCPAGKRPMKSRFDHDKGKGYALFFRDVCEKCPHKANCPVQKYGKHNYKWEYDAVKLRLRERRLHERTPEFKSEYRPRGGIEALNGNLKQNTALRRLRCRGKTAVYTAIYTIAAMHNIMQYAAYCLKTGKAFIWEELAVVFRLLWGRIAELSGFWRLNADDFRSWNIFYGQVRFFLYLPVFRKAGL